MLKVEKVNLHWGDIDMAHLGLEKLILHFEQSNKAEGKSEKTVVWYNEMLCGFIKFSLSKGQEAVLANFNATIVREFIIHEQGRELSPFTIQAKVRALKAFNPENFLRFVTGMGFDLSQIPSLVGQTGGFDPYRVLGLEKTATHDEIKKRYRELLVKLHPDTAGVRGTDFLLQMMIAAYQEIAKERGWG